MALPAAGTPDAGVSSGMSTPPAGLAQASQVLGQAGFVVTPDFMRELAARMGETTLLARSGGAPCLAAGRPKTFPGATSAIGGGGRTLAAYCYHFAIRLKALLFFTTVNPRNRVARSLLQEIAAH